MVLMSGVFGTSNHTRTFISPHLGQRSRSGSSLSGKFSPRVPRGVRGGAWLDDAAMNLNGLLPAVAHNRFAIRGLFILLSSKACRACVLIVG